MKVTVYLLNSFGINESGGNPAGVVLNAENLTDLQKMVIAKEIGFSETAFVEKSDKADFRVRFFTPTQEVDVCGHATIATYSLLLHKHIVKPGKYTHDLKPGIFPIEITNDDIILMDLALPIFSEYIPFTDLQDVFNISEKDIANTGLQPQIISTGSRNITIPIHSRKRLLEIVPNVEKMLALNKATNTHGCKLFTFDTIAPAAIAHSRDFAPLVGIPEDPATGVTTGALACYLYKHGKIKHEQTKYILFEQGYSVNRPSQIVASLEIEKEEIKRVQIGGKALLVGEKEIEI